MPCSVEVKHRSSSSSSSSGCLSPSSCSVVDSISTDSSDAENDDAGYYGGHNDGGEGPPGPIAAEGISPDMMGLRSKESEEEAERPHSSSGVSSRKTSAESVTSSG